MPVYYRREQKEELDQLRRNTEMDHMLMLADAGSVRDILRRNAVDQSFTDMREYYNTAAAQLCDLCDRPREQASDPAMLREMMQQVFLGNESFADSCGYPVNENNTYLAVVDLMDQVHKGMGLTNDRNLSRRDTVTIRRSETEFNPLIPPAVEKPVEPSRWMRFANFFGGYKKEFEEYNRKKSEYDTYTAISNASTKQVEQLNAIMVARRELTMQREEAERREAERLRVQAEQDALWREERVALHRIAKEQLDRGIGRTSSEDEKYFSHVVPEPDEYGEPSEEYINAYRVNYFKSGNALSTLDRDTSRVSMGHIMMLAKGFTIDQILSDDPEINQYKKMLGQQLTAMYRADDREGLMDVFRLAGEQLRKERLPEIDYTDPAQIAANANRLRVLKSLAQDYFQISKPYQEQYQQTYGEEAKRDYDTVGWVAHFADSAFNVAQFYASDDFVNMNRDGVGFSNMYFAAAGMNVLGLYGSYVSGRTIGEVNIPGEDIAEASFKSKDVATSAVSDTDKINMLVQYLRDGQNSPIHYTKGNFGEYEFSVTEDLQADDRRRMHAAAKDVLADYREGIRRDDSAFFGENPDSFASTSYSGLTTLDRESSRVNFTRLYLLTTTDMTMEEVLSDTPEVRQKKEEAGRSFRELFRTHYKEVREVGPDGKEQVKQVPDEEHYRTKIVPVLTRMHDKLAELKPAEVDFSDPESVRREAPKAIVQGYFSMDLGQALSSDIKNDVAAYAAGTTEAAAVKKQRDAYTVTSMAATQLRGITWDICQMYATNSYLQGDFDPYDDTASADSFKRTSQGVAALRFTEADTYRNITQLQHYSEVTPAERDFLLLETEEARLNAKHAVNKPGMLNAKPTEYEREIREAAELFDYALGRGEPEVVKRSERYKAVKSKADNAHEAARQDRIEKQENSKEKAGGEKSEEVQTKNRSQSIPEKPCRTSFAELMEEETPAKPIRQRAGTEKTPVKQAERSR